MRTLTVQDVTKSYGEKVLFDHLSFTISEKERAGLIGINGTGKSSLLRIVAGKDLPDEGEMKAPNDYSIAYLAQEPDLDPELTVMDHLFLSEAPVIQLLKAYEHTLKQLELEPDSQLVAEKLFDLQKQMDALGAWEASTNAKTIMTKLGIQDFNRKVGELSGGQKKRVALAQVLIETPDLLILDEPTNHLDYETIRWLEDYLSKYTGALLLVTHDRYFLDRVTNRIFELDRGRLYTYKGNYQDYIAAKAEREIQEAAAEEKRRNLYRRELAWMRRGAKARTTKQKARIDRFEQLEGKLGQGPKKDQLDLSVKGSRLGKQVFELKDVTKTFGEKVIIKDFNLIVKPGDRFGIVGKNGSGKSTFMNMLAGRIPFDSGEMITGQTVRIAYYTQERVDMDENQRVIAYIRESAEVVVTKAGETISAAQMLERFLFPMHAHGTPISKLSGGEKRRLYLLRLLMTQPNVLLLDEPTNDLDTETLTVLEDYLEDFPGVVITVSHDRYFLDKTADQLLVFEGDGAVDSYYGSYSDYLEEQSQLEKKTEPLPKEKKQEEQPKSKAKKKKLTYNEQREWETIEDDIAKVEGRIEEAEKELEEAGSDFEKAQRLSEEIEQLNEQLEHYIERWSYLSEYAQ
ncbi:ABC-F family ATP-binding cassette domain-containing protein [Bacillus thermotolerans]|uniref:ABC-F family ATP-binding cassette domain-containing protein n=1 Tax=Bacillus thermotolerans TaxID=1221996 RepID=UPI00057D270F|nr:ABC-F family ATP-binding cassette domain-containing protein [Bacillus thermotolerans]KKB38520.1 ATPase components of ABC transporter [Bacillus thermotolerans]KKB39936.1 ATPase components of ABC transporter [Bacillus thermotolerans]